MVNFCISDEEKRILRELLGKKLLKVRHDPLDKFGREAVYGSVELFFEDQIILVGYDYAPFPMFGGDDDRPKFFIKQIEESEAVSALEDTVQVNVLFGKVVSGIILVEDYAEVEWDDKKDEARILVSLIFQFGEDEIVFQGDPTIPLIEIIKGIGVSEKLLKPGFEFDDDPETRFKAQRFYIGV